jgi:hypothetical protein
MAVVVQTWIYRKYCRTCGVTFSLLPGFALAYHHHTVDVIASRTWEALQGRSCRDRDFLEQHAADVPAPEPGVNWSDLLASVSTRPCYQLLARWPRRLVELARERLHLLATACVLQGADLKAVAEQLSTLPANTPKKLAALALALGLWHGVGSVLSPTDYPDLASCLPRLIWWLHARPLPPKHTVLQASGGRLRYDSLVT